MTTLDTVHRPSNEPALLTINEAASALRVGHTLAYPYMATGEREGLPVIRVGTNSRALGGRCAS